MNGQPDAPRDGGQLPGTQVALEPGRRDFPQWPVTAADAAPFIQKVVG